ncbi:MAG: 2-succinyl-5-enolpyruvyl-6-hydroxy-3-cyclohexene-1-carboxylic-acid synthase, partial [Acidimicrobiales bacterium]
MTGDGVAQATFAATLVDEWVRAGVRHGVLSPGSRSTPLALALADDDRLTLHVHLDERSAAFAALGVGLSSGVPAVLLCTSGTAAANLLPAVVEAHQARVPVLVCTADRPPELQGFGAPQTIDQTRLFGSSVRWAAEPGPADPAAAGTWRSLAARAVGEATGSPPGPVHLNLGFRDPLVAHPGPLPEGRPGGRPWHVRTAPTAPDPATVGDIAGMLAGRRGVIVAGGGAGDDPAAVGGLAGVLGWPVLADPRSGCRVPAATTVAAADALLRHPPFAERNRPDIVLRLGAPPASKVVGEWLRDSGSAHVVIERDGAWIDPDRVAARLVAGAPGAWAASLAAGLGSSARADDGAWLASWATAELAAQRVLDDHLSGATASDPTVARAVAAALPDGTTLVVSSSMPVRDLEWYAAPRVGLRVLANRGANGIDGVTSTAVGVASAGGRTALLTGDLAFLHDTNGLLGLAARGLDLTIVVVDNRGGAIFSFLPQRASLPEARFEQLFGTPHDLVLADLAAVHGLTAATVHDVSLLGPTISGVAASPGVHVVVVPTDRSATVAVH